MRAVLTGRWVRGRRTKSQKCRRLAVRVTQEKGTDQICKFHIHPCEDFGQQANVLLYLAREAHWPAAQISYTPVRGFWAAGQCASLARFVRCLRGPGVFAISQ